MQLFLVRVCIFDVKVHSFCHLGLETVVFVVGPNAIQKVQLVGLERTDDHLMIQLNLVIGHQAAGHHFLFKVKGDPKHICTERGAYTLFEQVGEIFELLHSLYLPRVLLFLLFLLSEQLDLPRQDLPHYFVLVVCRRVDRQVRVVILRRLLWLLWVRLLNYFARLLLLLLGKKALFAF